jgi:signal transduction histidine kinase
MSIRQRILFYFSLLSTAVTGITFLMIFTVFSNYRREEYQQRIKDHIISTISLLAETKELNHNLLQNFGGATINKLIKEKTLIFDEKKKLIYSSIDDTVIKFPNGILNRLGAKYQNIETQEDDFEVVGVAFQFNGKQYYGIAKAYDAFGYSKLAYLKNLLIVLFFLFLGLILIASYILAKQISQPIMDMASSLRIINIETPNQYLQIPDRKDEIHVLASRFNDLMIRLKESFNFQKHAIHHISHELKTPISILVSNLEQLEKEKDAEKLRIGIKNQKEDTKLLGDMINSLLEIAKVETHAKLSFQKIRLDEIVFDCLADTQKLHPGFNFDILLDPGIENEDKLSVLGNLHLMQMAIQNLMLNCVHYSSKPSAKINFKAIRGELQIKFSNPGPGIPKKEIPYLFQHFFRGENSQGKRGFGLGLVLVNKVITLNGGKIQYHYDEEAGLNTFTIYLPELKK